MPDLSGDPLNPDTHRAAIVAVDAVLFEDGPLEESGRAAVARTLLELADVASGDKANTIAVRLGKDLRVLSDMTSRARIGTLLVDSQLRRHWLRIRSSLFDDAWWFRRSSADPIMPAIPDPPPPSPVRPPTPEERKGLELTLTSLSTLVERARRDLPNSLESEAHRLFAVDAERELVLGVGRLGPKPPAFGVDLFYQDAHRYAAEALRVMRVLAGLGTGAPRSSREYLINKAEEHIAQARKLVADIR